jgi:hypothetical protein
MFYYQTHHLVGMGQKQKTSELEDWARYAKILEDIERLQLKLMKEMSGNVPESVYQTGWEKMSQGENKLKSDLEIRYANEHPGDWSTHMFYGDHNENELYD